MKFRPGQLPLSVIMITLNEAHNFPDCVNQLNDWAAEVCVLDSFSSDNTEELSKKLGIKFKKRKFT